MILILLVITVLMASGSAFLVFVMLGRVTALEVQMDELHDEIATRHRDAKFPDGEGRRTVRRDDPTIAFPRFTVVHGRRDDGGSG